MKKQGISHGTSARISLLVVILLLDSIAHGPVTSVDRANTHILPPKAVPLHCYVGNEASVYSFFEPTRHGYPKHYVVSKTVKHGPFHNISNDGYFNGNWCFSVSRFLEGNNGSRMQFNIVHGDRAFGPYDGVPDCYGDRWVTHSRGPAQHKEYFLHVSEGDKLILSGPYLTYYGLSHQDAAYVLEDKLFYRGAQFSIPKDYVKGKGHGYRNDYGELKAVVFRKPGDRAGFAVFMDGKFEEYDDYFAHFASSPKGNNWVLVACKRHYKDCSMTFKNGHIHSVSSAEDTKLLSLDEQGGYKYFLERSKYKAPATKFERELGDFLMPLLLAWTSPAWIVFGIPDHSILTGEKSFRTNDSKGYVMVTQNGTVKSLQKNPWEQQQFSQSRYNPSRQQSRDPHPLRNCAFEKVRGRWHLKTDSP